MINALAGGGTLISFPALIAAGYDSKIANVTNTVAILPGYLGGSLAYRKELSIQRGNILTILPPTIVGAILGAALLLSTPQDAFDVIVPFLILGACLLLGFQDRLSKAFGTGEHSPDGARRKVLLQVGVLIAATYGSYFGAGLGIIVLAVLGLFMPDDIQRSNALKGIISFIVNLLGAVYFMIFADVAFDAAAVMAVAALSGGYGGARLARHLSRSLLKRFVITYGSIAAVVFFVRLFA
jgi:uncharacterized protein